MMMDIFGENGDGKSTVSSLKSSKLRTIRLYRKNGFFGFGLRGGREHNIGFYVSTVIPGSESELQGLSVGDQVIRIDGLPVAEALHKEMLNFIRSKTQITLSVKSGNLVPFYECTNQTVSWRPAKAGSIGSSNNKRRENEGHPVLSASSSWSSGDISTSAALLPSFASLTLRAEGQGRFGCSVCEGPPHKKGVYVRSTDEGSVARFAGLKVGDRILHCNGMDVTTMDFDEAVELLKESTVLNLVVSRGAGSDFISPGESSGYNSAASSINGDQSPMQNGKQKRLSVVREEIMDVIDERRGLVVGSVTVDCHQSWNDIGNEEWTESKHEHHHRGPVPAETINKDVKMSHSNGGSQQEQQQRLLLLQQQEEERKLLQEERWRIQEAQRKLAEEKEKLARDRLQLEEARIKLMNGTVSSQQSATVRGQTEGEAVKIIPKPIHQQHEQLMEEFKQKMVDGLKSPVHHQQVQLAKTKISIPANTVHNNRSTAHQVQPIALKPGQHSAQPPPPPPPPLPNSSGGPTTTVRKKQAPPPPPPVTDNSRPPVAMDDGQSDGNVVRRNNKPSKPAVRVSIGTYHVQPEPTKMDFLPPKSRSVVGLPPLSARSTDDVTTKSLLQAELSQTLSRARLRQRQSLESISSIAADNLPVETEPPVPPSVTFKPGSSAMHELKSRNAGGAPSKIGSVTSANNQKAATTTTVPAVLSTFGRHQRQASMEIQAKVASLAAAAASSSSVVVNTATGEQRSTVNSHNNNNNGVVEETISQCADNKVTIKVSPYTSTHNRAQSTATTSSSSSLHQKSITLGQTTYYIDSVPVTEL